MWLAVRVTTGRVCAGRTARAEAVGVLMVEHRDRLARFGVRVIEHMLACHGLQVTYVGEPEDGASGEAELVAEVPAAVASLAGRRYGHRPAKTGRLSAVLRQDLGAG